jgi:hypothetical protein
MGLYDSIHLDIKCPFCEETSEMECQTKQLDGEFNHYRKDDFIDSDDLENLECITECVRCLKSSLSNDIVPRVFFIMLNVGVKSGFITGNYEITNKRSHESTRINLSNRDKNI